MSLSPVRVRLALIALALGGFGIGSTEFVVMGLLSNISADLLPDLWASDPEGAIGRSGLLISAYALGVVVGAPLIAALAARMPRKRLLLILLVAFTLGNLASALLPTFEWVLAARFVAALPHGAYFGVASLVAANLLGPGKRGQGIAFVLGGLTVATLAGVPLITAVGQAAGWRASYLFVTAIFALTVVAVQLAVPAQPGNPNASVASELSLFRRSAVWLTLAMGAIGFGGFFAVYSYVDPLTTEVARLPLSAVPLLLIVIGAGMTIGNFVGGWAADQNLRLTMYLGFALLLASLLGAALFATSPIILGVCLFLLGASSSGLSPTIQTRLLDVAGESQTLASALNHASLNLGNSLGAYLGGVVITAGLGYASTAWVGIVLASLGLVIAIYALQIHRTAKIEHTQPIAWSPPAG